MGLSLDDKESMGKIFILKILYKAKCGVPCLKFKLLERLRGEGLPEQSYLFIYLFLVSVKLW